jgi:F0F1-type ATP synthase assembly protein I
MYNGFGNALSQAIELVVTPLLFGLFGFWLDGRLGTRPVFTIVIGALGVVGMAVKTFYVYRDAMEREQEGKPWTRSPR